MKENNNMNIFKCAFVFFVLLTGYSSYAAEKPQRLNFHAVISYY